MDKDRDEILNDLIKYYDGGKKNEDAADDTPGFETSQDAGSPSADTADSLGDTRVVRPQAAPAPDALGGDTIAVNVSRTSAAHDTPAQPGSDNTGDTRHIGPIQEEVLGSLGLDGLPIDPNAPQTNDMPHPETHETGYDTEPEYYNDGGYSDEYDNDEEYHEDYYDDDEYDDEYSERPASRGIWFTLKPLWITMIISGILVAGFFFYMTDTGIIGTYKRNFDYNMNMLMDMLGIDFQETITDPVDLSDNASNAAEFEADIAAQSESSGTQQSGEIRDNVREELPSEYTAVTESRARLPFVEADNSGFAVYGSGVVCAKSNYLCLYSNTGELKWETATDVQNPILSTAGSYIAIAADGGTRLSLYKDDEQLFSVDAENNIISCDVSERGDIVLVTERSAYKGAVTVINRRGEEIFSWASGVNYITSASILKTRLVAVSLVNAETNVTSYLMVFDIESPDPLAGVELTDTLVFDVFNNGRTIYTSGDNSVAAMSEYCEMQYDKRFDDASITHTANDTRGNRLISYTIQNIPALNVYKRNGDLLCTLALDSNPDYIDVYGSTILYNNGRDIICGAAADEDKSIYTAPMDIKDLVLINSKTYLIVYENSIEFIRI